MMTEQKITTDPSILMYNLATGQGLSTSITLSSSEGPTLQITNSSGAGYVEAGGDGTGDIFISPINANTVSVNVSSSLSSGTYTGYISVKGDGTYYKKWTKEITIIIRDLPDPIEPTFVYDGPYIYNAKEQSVTFESATKVVSNYLCSATPTSISGNKATIAGNYTCSCTYYWTINENTQGDTETLASGVKTVTKDWTILDPPQYPDHINPKFNYSGPFTYDGNEKTVSFEKNTTSTTTTEYAGITITWELLATIITDSDISGTLSAITPGNYTATANYSWQVRPTANYDGETKSGRDTYNASWTINKAAGELSGLDDVTLYTNSTTSVEYVSTGELTWSYVSGLDDINLTSSQIDSSIKTRITIESGSQSGVAYYLLTSASTNNYEAATLALKITVNELPQSNFYVTPTELDLTGEPVKTGYVEFSGYAGDVRASFSSSGSLSGSGNIENDYISVKVDTSISPEIYYGAIIKTKSSANWSGYIYFTDDGGSYTAPSSPKPVFIESGLKPQSVTFNPSTLENALIGKKYKFTPSGNVGSYSGFTCNSYTSSNMPINVEFSNNELYITINGLLDQFKSGPLNVTIYFNGTSDFASGSGTITLTPLKESYVNLYKNNSWETYLIKLFKKDENGNFVPCSCDAKVHKKDGQIHKWLKLGVYDEES